MDHAEIRALRRYGLTLTPEIRASIMDKARNNPIKRVYRLAARRYICTVAAAGQVLRVVLNQDMTQIVTFLPRKAKFKGF
jgi:hypothetical protein